jgi:ABC-type sugar transport system permease subunit
MALVERNLRRTGRYTNQTGTFIAVTVMLTGGVLLGLLTWSEVSAAYAAALEAGEGLDIWTQIITISAGFLLLLLAWWVWESASDRTSTLSVFFRLAAASMLMVGAWVLIGELPRAVASGDEVWWRSLLATVYYVMGTVPTQLIIGLGLAVLLFQKIWGQSFFRVVFFLPYIAPFVGTAAVFRIIFSNRSTGPMNSIFTGLGFDPLLWLNEPTGIFQMMAGSTTLSYWLAGPSLALIVIMIFGIWTYAGFGTVIFLAGLGSIPRELYEVSDIDGAGKWAQFRHITLPMLSPTIYFLTLYSVIGTFKAFNHIYVLRQAAALGTSDTVSIVIFQAFKRDTRFGYASAMAILLLIIILLITVFNNRIASRRVFYG